MGVEIYIYGISVFIIWIGFIYILSKLNILKKLNISLFGPMLMLRTKKGRIFIDKLSRPRKFWHFYSTIAIIITLIAMVSIFLILILGAIAAMEVRAKPLPPEMMLALPGINPIIPLWYGIFALAIAIVIHEFAHGILACVAKIKIKSIGMLICIIPIGAFVEPDDKQIEKTKHLNRIKIFSMGPGTNIVFAFLCAMIFSWCFMASLSPVEEGVIIFNAFEGPTRYGSVNIEPGMEIIEINGEPIRSFEDYYKYNGSAPNETIYLQVYYKGEYRRIDNITSGLTILSLLEGYPAHGAGLKEGMIIAEVDGYEIRNGLDFSEYMGTTRPFQEITMTVYEYDEVRLDIANQTTTEMYLPKVFNITLEDKYEYYKNKIAIYDDEKELIESTKGKGYLGMDTTFLGLHVVAANDFTESLAHPVTSAESSFERRSNIFQYAIGLPMDLNLGILPFHSPIVDLYEVEGPLGVLPEGLFWVLANAFYYLFWINILVGTFNALPAIPLDGGYVFKDGMDSIIGRVKKGLNDTQREHYVKIISYSLAFFILMLIIWTLTIPWII